MNSLWRLLGRTGYVILYPFLALYLRKDERARVVIRYKGKVLLVKHWLGSGRWDLPGGGIHREEEPVVGICREINEELGLKIDPRDIMSIGQYPFREGLMRYRAHYFKIELNKVPELNIQKTEIAAVDWFTPEELNVVDISRSYKDILI